MSWFEEQIKQRKKSDNDIFEDSFINLTDSVLGEQNAHKVLDEFVVTTNAIGEIVKYFRLRHREVPRSITDLEEQLEFLLRPHGIMRRNVALEKGWYKHAVGPYLAFTKEDGTAVALIPEPFGGYSFLHPKTGARTRVNRRTQELFSEDAICFYSPIPQGKISRYQLVQYIFKQINAVDIFMMVNITAFGVFLGLFLPRINEIIFSGVIYSQSLKVLAAVAVLLISVTISKRLVESAKGLIMARIQTRVSVNIQAATMARVLSLPVSFFAENTPGEVASWVSCMDELSNTLISAVLSTGLTASFSIVYLLQVAKYADGLVAIVVAIVVIYIAVHFVYVFVKSRYGITEKLKDHGTESITYSMINGIQKIRLAGAEKRMFAKWAEHYAQDAMYNYNPPVFVKLMPAIVVLINYGGYVAIFIMALSMGINQVNFLAFLTTYGLLSGAIGEIGTISESLAEFVPMLYAIEPILSTEPEISESKDVIEGISGAIELNNVSFRYSESMPNVIDNLSLKIHPGQYVAICGASGCGKSTLFRLLLGFEKPKKGSIFYDSKNISNIDLKALRRMIGCVMQNGGVFSGDVFSNIAISAPWITMEEAWEAAELAGIADDIREMPMGMKTVITEGRSEFSGGQKQRLMIASAIAPKPKVLIFDEATSALDNITQKKISDSLASLKCTRIVAAHRLSTIKNCDRILVLDQGKIVEDGTYEELIEKNGFFAELVKEQRID